MALPRSFAESTANSIFDRIIKSAEAVFMKPLHCDPSRLGPKYDRESFLKCGAVLVGKFVLTRNTDFAQAALQKIKKVLIYDCYANTQVFLYKSIINTLNGFLRWKDESYDLYRLHCFVESRCDIQCAINLKNGSAVAELCRRCEGIIVRAQKAILKDCNPTKSIRSIYNYLSSADEQLDETTMVDFEDLIQRLRKVAARQLQLKRMDRKFSLCLYDSDGEEEHPLQALVTSMVILQKSATPKDGPAKDGGGSGASSADGEENNIEKAIRELVDFTQFAIFDFFRISAEEIHDNDDLNSDNLTMSGTAWLGRSLLEKSSEDAYDCLQTAVVKLEYALEMAPNKNDALFYLKKALEAIDLLKYDTSELVACANDSMMGMEEKKVAVKKKRKLGGMEYQNS